MEETNYALSVEFKKFDNDITNIFVKNGLIIVGTAIIRCNGDLAILSKIEIFSRRFFEKKIWSKTFGRVRCIL